ncbi:FimV/HubP family polar landmark protein [Dyella silvatica]|uniref:FimV/HubP family polar landmark protein n=1 Tax=Dyella silvatica TaxID=2992128 RepID=UPI00224D7524|nr:FimV/HubP family polar landmark protein [Dyella silvatica]
MPSKEDAQAIAAAAAMAEVRRQNSDWRSGAAKVPTTVADAGTRASASSSPGKAANAADRLALVPAKDGGASVAGKGDTASMHQDLLRSQETLTALQQQGDELKSRLKDLEDINGKNERLLSLKDNEIAELQRKLGEARKSVGTPAEVAAAALAAKAVTPPAEDKTVVTTAAPASKLASVASTANPAAVPAVTPASAGTAAAGAVASAAVATPKPAAPAAAKPAPVKPTPAPVVEDPWYMQTWAWAAGAGAILVLALLALLSRRRKPVTLAPTATGSSLAERFGAAPVNPHAGDTDQDELLDQLAEHPDDIGLHLELVSLYYGRRDVEHFEAAAEAMHAHIANPQQVEWQDVVHMGEDLVPGHPLFTPNAPQPPQGADEHAALHHFDLDSYSTDQGLGIPPPIKPAAVPAREAKSTVSEYHFGFNLTPGAEDAPIVAHDLPAHHEPVKPIESAPHAEHTSWQFADEPVDAEHAGAKEHHEFGHFSDDPSDTKLDLARAYLDMGDPDGARSMLEEVLHEGSQMQKDTAKRLLADLH